VLDGDLALLLQKGAEPPCPIFGPFLLWPNGWMHHDVTWYGCRPQPRGLRVRWRTSPPSHDKGVEPPPSKFSAHVYCGQTAGWMKTPLGTEVDLCSCHVILDGVPAPARGTEPPPPFSAHVCCGHSRPSQLLLSSC